MFHDVTATVISGLILSLILTLATAIYRWMRKQRILLQYVANEMTNDGNGSWRSNMDRRLTAIEKALPGVTPQPENEEK